MFVVPNEIKSFLENLPKIHQTWVVGVSGGADSLYLAFVLNEWTKKKDIRVVAVTVNHGLRPEAKKEAEFVHNLLTHHHIEHKILTWRGVKPKTHIEEIAREKRYELLTEFCQKVKSDCLFLAHHNQDQAETFWARLARGSGLDGLNAMRAISKRQDITLVRPMLNLAPDMFRTELKKNHIQWVEDPMNLDMAYERVRWRQNQSLLDKMGLTARVLERTIDRLQAAKDALDFYADRFIKEKVKWAEVGYVCMPYESFFQLPFEIRVRVALRLFKELSPVQKIIPLESAEKIAAHLPKYATLAGCQWVANRTTIFMAQELKYKTTQKIPAFQWVNWGNVLMWTNKSFVCKPGAPTPHLKKIPFLIQRTFPNILPKYTLLTMNISAPYYQKELEKKLKLDYKNRAPIVIVGAKSTKENG